MADLNRPDYGQVWASTGEKVAPDTVKMQSGWVQEMMPFQYENYLQARQDEAIVYLLQKGVPEYSSTQEYIANKSVVVYQGNLYMATATVTNVLPTVTASWKRLNPSLAANGAVPVSSGGTGATTASEARTNLGLGSIATSTAPATNGIVVKDANDSLVARTITGTSGNIIITNPDGVSGNINVNVGSNIAQLSQDSSWTSKGGIRIPSGSTGERGTEVAGKIRYNTTLQKFEGFDGTSWNALGASSNIEITTLSGNGVTTDFTLNSDAFSAVATDVYIGGIYQNKASYSVSGSTITFSEAPVAGVDNIQVLSRRVVDLGLSTATQVSIQDTTNLYTSSTVEGALREVGEKAKYVKNAILSYPDYAAASAAAATLPDGQAVKAPNSDGRLSRFEAQGNVLVFKDYVPDAIRMQSYAALQAYSGKAAFIDIRARGVAGHFYRDDEDTASAANGWSIFIDALNRRWKRQDADTVDITPDLFGARNDNTTPADDEVQAAIDFCNSTNPARPLKLTGRYKITSQLMIDRMVDTTKGEFVIYSNGDEGTGFYISGVADGFKLFGSRIPYGPPVESYPTTPVTEFVTLRGISVVNTTVHNNVYIFDNKYLRVTLEQGFKGRKVRIFEGAPYLQSIRSIGSKFRDHTEFLIDVQDGYDVHFDYTQIEKSGKGFRFNGVLRGGSFDKGLFQANVGPYLTFAGAVSVSVANNYFEQNTNPDLIFGLSGGSYNGVTLADNFHFLSTAQAGEPSFYPVVLGAASKVVLSGNVSSGNLFDNTQCLPFSVTAQGNAADGKLFAVPYMTGELGASGTNQATANPVARRYSYVTSGLTSSGVKLPKISALQGGDVYIVNMLSVAVYVYPFTGERFLGLVYNAPVTLAAGASLRAISSESDAWILA